MTIFFDKVDNTSFFDYAYSAGFNDPVTFIPCSCCGAIVFTENKSRGNDTGKGIVIINGIHGEPQETEDFTRAHVKTSAGSITIQLAHNRL